MNLAPLWLLVKTPTAKEVLNSSQCSSFFFWKKFDKRKNLLAVFSSDFQSRKFPLHQLSEGLASLGIMRAQSRSPLIPLDVIVLRWSKGFQTVIRQVAVFFAVWLEVAEKWCILYFQFGKISICKWIYKPMVLFHLIKKKSMKDWTIILELVFTATASAVFHWLSSLDNSEVLVWIFHFQAALHREMMILT